MPTHTPFTWLLAIYFLLAALPNKKESASFDAHFDVTYGNETSSVNQRINISSTIDFNREEPAAAKPVEVSESNITSINFISIDGDKVEHSKYNNRDRKEENKNTTVLTEVPSYMNSTLDKIKNFDIDIKERRDDENMPFEPIEHSFEMSNKENTTISNPAHKEQLDNDKNDDIQNVGVSSDIMGMSRGSTDDVTLSGHRFDDDDDDDENRNRIDEYDEEEDEYDGEDTDEYGIRDTCKYASHVSVTCRYTQRNWNGSKGIELSTLR